MSTAPATAEAPGTSLPLGAIRFRDVHKKYPILKRASPRFGAWVLNKVFEHFRTDEFEALGGVSLDVKPGEMVGLVGPNGAGKSTILKLIAGITEPSAGHVEVNGPVTSLLELGVGFHPDLTGMENIFYNGAIMGMSRDGIHARLGEIIAFSGLEEFLFEPVKHYSSGMYSRLACSVALHLDPRIILVDEILAVGDAEFQQRAILKILELHRRGVTILLVTHETATARDICDRLVWIEDGRIVHDGDPGEVHRRYTRHMNARALVAGHYANPEDGDAEPGMEHTLRAGLVDANGASISEVFTGQQLTVELSIQAAANARLLLGCRWSDGKLIFEDSITISAGTSSCRYEIPRWPLHEAEVTFSCGLVGEDGRLLVRLPEFASLRSRSGDEVIYDTISEPLVRWRMRKL